MNSYVVITKTLIHRAYEVDAPSPEAAAALFGPYVDVEDDGSIYDENGEKVISSFYGETVREVLECRLHDGTNRAEKAHANPAGYRPRKPTPGELRKAGVEIMDASGFALRCLKCGGVWAPGMLRGGRLPRHYWRCPHSGCR